MVFSTNHAQRNYKGIASSAQGLLILDLMARPLRYIPPNSVVEVTTRTIQGRLLLRPSPELNDILLGILGRALTLYPIALHAFAITSNHVHLLLSTPTADTLAQFMNYLNSNIAREAGRLHHWREKFWGRRYRSIPVLDDEAVEARLRYLLAHGCKEGLVERPAEWPGPSCLPALLHGQVLRGIWFDRTAEYRARRKGETRGKQEFARSYEVPLTPIPSWSHLKPDEQRRRAAELVAEIETTERDNHQTGGRVAPGPEFISAQEPHDKPRHSQHSPAPLCHTSSQDMRNAFREAYASFVELFHKASSQLRANVPSILFPHHCFPPAHRFYEGFLEPAPS